MNDISIVWRVFSLPILEPMTRSRLQKIVSITDELPAGFHCSHHCYQYSFGGNGEQQLKGGSTSKDDEIDGYASIIVHKIGEFSIEFPL